MQKRFFKFILFLILIWGILNFRIYALDSAEEIKLYVDETKIISVNNPQRIVIGRPEIADVVSATEEEISLIAKSAGTTTLVIWDNFGEQAYQVKVFAEDMRPAKERIDNLLKTLGLAEVYTRIDEEESKVLLLGRVKESGDIERINTALGTLKTKTVNLIQTKEEETVVDINVEVLELSKDAARTLGFTWPGSLTVSTDQAVTAGNYTGTIPTSWHTFFRLSNWSRMPFEFKLDALVTEGKARILSRPRLSCQSGKEAKLLVGGEVPIFTSTTIGGVGGTTVSGNVEYKEYGIILNIKPRVSTEDPKRIHLNLGVDVSDLGTVEETTYARAYPLIKRTINTELFINEGETLVIGGLIKQKTEEEISRFPWLSDIPILGEFFKRRASRTGGGTGERGNIELFITLTPTVIPEKKLIKEAKKEAKPQIKPVIVSSSITKSLPTPIEEYSKVIQNRILDNLTYPTLAKEAGFQGTVKLGLRLSYQGKLLEAKIKESSGYKILDDNALSTAQEIANYPPFPSSIDFKELWIEIPITYLLE